MKEDLIKKLLDGQTTPDEEHQIACMLKPADKEVSRWLTEDETSTYDAIVSQRRSKRQMVRWAAAAIAVVMMTAGGAYLWNRHDANAPVAHHPVPNAPHPVAIADTTAVQPSAAKTVVTVSIATKRPHMSRKATAPTSTADSLQYYIARLEKELEQVADSNYSAKAEEIIRADVRMQRLVQRIMIGEIEKSGQPVETLLDNQGKEEQP